MNSASGLPVPEGRHGHWCRVSEAGIDCHFWIDEPSDTIQSVLDTSGSFYEVEALRVLRSLLPNHARIVDVGANIGNHAVFFCRVCEASRVVLIEPNPEILPELRANLAANGCSAADASKLGVAAGAAPGRMRLQIASVDSVIRNRGGARLVERADGDPLDPTVEVVRLDGLLDETFDLLKIATEGTAVAVLEGAERLIARSRPMIYVEVGVLEMPAFFDWLHANAYRVTGALSDYAGLTNMVLAPAAAGTAVGMPEPDERSRLTGILAAVAAAEARAKRADKTLDILIGRSRELEAQRENADRRAAESAARATAASVLAAEQEARADEAERHRHDDAAARLRAEHETAQTRAVLAQVSNDAAALKREIERLRAIEASTFWRATGPLRRATSPLPPAFRRQIRRGLTLAWWTASLQLSARLRQRRARSPVDPSGSGRPPEAAP